MPNYHTPIIAGAVANAQTFNDPLTELDNALVSLSHQQGVNPLLAPYNLSGLWTEDATATLQDLFNENASVYLPLGSVFRCTERLPIHSDMRIFGGGTLLIDGVMAGNGYGNAFLYGAGDADHTDYTLLPGNVSAGAFSADLAVGDGSNWAAGDWIIVESEDAYRTNPNTIYPKEVRQLYAVVGDTVYFSHPLVWSYTTANNARYYRMTPIENILIEDIRITNTDPLTNLGYALRLDRAVDVRIRGLDVYDSGGAVVLYGVHRFDVDGYHVWNMPNGRESSLNSAYGYGMTLDDTTSEGTIRGMVGGMCRHVLSTIFEQRSGSDYGGPQFVTVADSIGYGEISGLSIWDTHDGGFDLTFDNVVAMGASSDGTFISGSASSGYGFQIRMDYATLRGCRAFYCGERGVSFNSGARYGKVEGGEFAFNALNGISLGEGCVVRGVEVHHNGQQAFVCGTGVNNWIVEDSYWHDNGVSAAAYYGFEIQASGGTATTGWAIRNSRAPSGSNTHAIGFTNTNVTGKIIGNDFDGYTGGNAITGAPSSGVVIKNNEGYITRKVGATSVADGGTISHGLAGTPTRVNVTPSTSGEFVSVTAKSSSTFTCAIKKHDNSAGTTQTVYWEAEIAIE